VITKAQFRTYDALLGELRLPYVPVDPSARQEWFLLRDELEVFFGGAAGGGKSFALLMAALQYCDVPGYHALLLRPTLKEFDIPEGLIEISHEWLAGVAHWNGSAKRWTFPSGATLTFGYLANMNDIGHYKGTSLSFCGFDELTSFDERLYRTMFRVLRQSSDLLEGVPLRMRSASNPGGPGHLFVKSRFIDPDTRQEGTLFIPSKLQDNPYLDTATYIETLSYMDPVERARLIAGDWDVTEEGTKFRREDFLIVEPDEVPISRRAVRYWDLAATEPSPSNTDPDWTVGLLLEVDDRGLFTIRDIARGRWSDDKVEEVVHNTAKRDGHAISVWIEQEPGSSGKLLLSHFKRKVLQGYACHAGLTRGKEKEVRARPVAAAVANHLVRLVRCPNFQEFLDECALFGSTAAAHDDCVDALSGAHTALSRGAGAPMRSYVSRKRIPTRSTDRMMYP
jgi:predicted phage terminase large subunit-like protein